MSKDLRFVVVSFVVWKAVIFLAIIIGFGLFPMVSQNLKYTYVFSLGKQDTLWNSLFFSGVNFDGQHYLYIAQRGYVEEGRFMPVFPFLIYMISLGQNVVWAAISSVTLVNVIFFVDLVLLFKILKSQFSEKIAKLSVVSLLVFPTSYYWGSVYSESVFLLVSLGFFYFLDKGKLVFAGVLAVLLTLTRVVGVAALPVVFGVMWLRNWFWALVSLPLLLCGLAAYSVYNQVKWGQAFYFIQSHGDLGNSREVANVILLPQTVWRYIKILLEVPIFSHAGFVAAVELSSFIFVICLLLWGWKKLNWKYLVYSVVVVLVPALSGTFLGLSRYVLVAFPLYILIAFACKSRSFKYLYFSFSLGLLVLLTLMFSRGYFVA